MPAKKYSMVSVCSLFILLGSEAVPGDAVSSAHTVDAEGKELTEYLTAAIDHHKDDTETVLAIKSSQAAWNQFRDKHCDSIFMKWRDGTIRVDMYKMCYDTMTKKRTCQIWNDYMHHPQLPEVMPNPCD
jgi:uncharacterized protein YecT (DUF1311 family)